jgi:hypothetical protein
MSNDKKVAQDRKEKIKKEKKELFEKICLALLTANSRYSIHTKAILIADADILTDAVYDHKKGIK